MKYYLPNSETKDDARLPIGITDDAGYDAGYFAELAAEHFYGNEDGWEATWPVVIAVIDEDGAETRWSVALEMVPEFAAYEMPIIEKGE